MSVIGFTVHTIPIAQPRQRHRIVKTASGGEFVSNYTPTRDPVNSYKAALYQAAHEAYDGPPLDGPLIVRLLFVLPRPKALCWKSRPQLRQPHCARPDVDNLVKSTLDALKGLLWRDDPQVATLVARKVIASGDEQPHVDLLVMPCAGPLSAAEPEEESLFEAVGQQ